jgi:hypothetical protein
MKLTETFQKFLPFGYLFLVLIGILKESVFYYQIGLNILKYSTIMDILISPIADLTSEPIILIALIIFIIILFSLMKILSKNGNRKWVKKLMNSKTETINITDEEIQNYFGKSFIIILSIGLLSFFLGIGIGNGVKVSKKILKNKLEYTNKITFNSGETKDIYLIGSNSVNYFYTEKGNKNVIISPVGAVKSLEIIKMKRNEK